MILPAPSWRGPLGVHALKTTLREMARELSACADQSELDGILECYRAAIEQSKYDLPDWYEGTPDGPGIKTKLELMEMEFSKGEQNAHAII